MAKMVYAEKMCAMAAVGVLAALVGSTGVAQDRPMQDARRVRPVKQAQLLELAPLPELVLLPEPVPLPLQVPLAADQAPPPQQAEPPQQAPVLELTPPPRQDRPLRAAWLSELAPVSEWTPPPEQAPLRQKAQLREQTLIPEQAQPVIAIFESTDFPPANPSISIKDHPAVGAYFGKAIQVCAAGVAPSACAGGQQAGVLFMNPVLTGDGLLIADDSLTLLGAPYGPHACAHGSWVPTSATEFTAEYTFITSTFPPATGTISGLRARWVAQVLDANTLVGWVNAYFLSSSPVTWTPLAADQFPAFPPEAAGFVTAPNGFVKDPSTCMTAGCPQVFKFTLKRITR